ncbi:MAG: porphobilinogen synthase [Verrucomicrobiota bacterium]
MDVDSFSLPLSRRPRRLRQTAAIRDMVRESRVDPAQLIQPFFVVDADSAREPIDSMPGNYRLGRAEFLEELKKVVDLGIRGVAIFPRIESSLKTETGREEALNPDGLIPQIGRLVREAEIPVNLIADVALDPYTSHGHDGILDSTTGEILNDPTVEILAEMAVNYARAGIDWVAPSDMMDGRVGAIRDALDDFGFQKTVILAYSAKFASAFYGPFRDAVGSAQKKGSAYLDKSTYQLSPANLREAMVEVDLDINEGADIVMVKPAGPYLDVIREVRNRCEIPVAAYQVSGEFSAIHAAAEKGWLDYEGARDESVLAIRRAGADLILTYFAAEIAAGD